jgi:hypothetical protein
MGIRFIVALFLGLLMQWPRVASRLGDCSAAACATIAATMTCCEGESSCSCAEESTPSKSPAPLGVVDVDLKLFLAKAPKTLRLGPTLTAEKPVASLTAVSRRDAHAGFAEVPLAVALSNFLI